MAYTQQDITLQMVTQLKILDPSLSAEVGSPERKILDTVSEQLASMALNIGVVDSGLDLTSKSGSVLDAFLALLRFTRQQATAATGFVTLNRITALDVDIPIPSGTQVASGTLVYQTSFDVTLPAGQLSVVAPIEAIQLGSSGNVAAHTITSFVGTITLGVTSVDNEIATSGGEDEEDDDALKVRFKNTVFRNLAGTEDQYLALAIATPYTTKANVVGPLSRYTEYVQVPAIDDSNANGNAGEWTTALSTIPYSKHIYGDVPSFVQDGQNTSIFYREDTDFRLNTTFDRDQGDTYRLKVANQGSDPNIPDALYQPNVTFLNVYAGADDTVIAVRPGAVMLLEHSYMSTESRNDWERNITNAVDVFVNGANNILADTIVPLPNTDNIFVGDPNNAYYWDNYRRYGLPEHRPVLGNLFTPLFNEPVVGLPNSITVANNVYYKGTHYWLVQDVSELYGTIRARNGIEWNKYLGGQSETDDPNTTIYTGPPISEAPAASVAIQGYLYDQNITDIQTSITGTKQVTTDVLVHTAKSRYFKLDVTVMYSGSSSGANYSTINVATHDSITTFFNNLYFGSTIQLSDLLAIVHGVSGMDNVRWSRDLPLGNSEAIQYNRVIECDINGNPLLNAVVDKIIVGSATTQALQQIYLTGAPTGGTFAITYNQTTTAPIAFNASAGAVQVALQAIGCNATVTGLGTPDVPFAINFLSKGEQPTLVVISTLSGGPSVLNNDFYLKDNEMASLPASALINDSAPGLIIRPRAQGTWTKT